jgi:phage-related protein
MAFAAMAAPSGKAQDVMHKLGLAPLSLAKALRSGGLPAAIGMLKKHLSGLSDVKATQALTMMFGAKSSQAILTLIGNTEDYARVQKQIVDNSTDAKFKEAIAAQAKDATAKWAQLKTSLGATAVEFGEILLPSVMKLVGGLGKLTKWMGGLSPAGKKTIAVFALTAAAIGPLLILLGSMAKGVGALISISKGLYAMPGGIKGLGSKLGGVGTGVGKMGASIKATAGSIATAVGNGFKAAGPKLKLLLQSGLTAASKGLKVGVSAVASFAGSAAGLVKDTAATIANTAARAAHAVATGIQTAAQWALNAAMAVSPITWIILGIVALVAVFIILWKRCKWFRDFWKAVWHEIVVIARAVWGFIKPGLDLIWKGIKVVWGKVWAAAKWVWARIGPFVIAYVRALWQGLKFWFAVISKVLHAAWTGLVAITRKVWPVVLAIVRGYMTNLRIAIAVIKVVIGIVRAVWHAVAAVTRVVWKAIAFVVHQAVQRVVTAVHIVQKVVAVVRKAWHMVKTVTSTIWNGLKAVIGAVIDWIWDKISGIWDKLSGVYNKVKGWLGGGGDVKRVGKGAYRIPHRAEGGWTPATTGGQMVVMGEGGEGEWSVPASKARDFANAFKGGKSGGDVNLTIHIANVNGTDRQAARRLADMVKQELMGGVLRQMVGHNA